MRQEQIIKFYKIAVISLGGAALVISSLKLDGNLFSWGFLFFIVFTLTIASRLNLSLPRANISLSFSDVMVFTAFLLYGGEVAVILSAIETLINCLPLKRRGVLVGELIVSLNVAMAAVSTATAYLIWHLLSYFLPFTSDLNQTANLITALGILAVSQFLASSTLAAAFNSLKSGARVWKVWRKEGLTISITQIVGAGFAGVIYKLINYGDLIAAAVAGIVFAIAYFTYRHIINEMTTSIEEAERAQREKAETEKIRAEQAEHYAEELSISLQEQQRISEALRQSKDAFQHAALHDPLTKLANRAYLIERIQLLMEIGIQVSNKYFILFLDLSRFKNINDSLGHNTGDKVLKLVAKRLQQTVQMEDTVARLGGDEFAIILNDLSSIEEAQEYALKIKHKLSQPFTIQGNKIFTDVHIGVAPFDSDYKTPEEILRDADIAMHYAKEKGMQVAVFDKELRSRFLEIIKLEADLRFAADRGELSMHYQPLICLDDGEIMGFEALLRWHHPKLGFISPARFIPIAEDSGQIIPITNWILKQTTEQIAKWQNTAHCSHDLVVSVNISGKHLNNEALVDEVQKVLRSSKIKPASLKLEITESTAMENAERTIEILSKLKQIGVQLSIDDFGTGYSSLSYLHRLPFDTLKIDRSFVYSVGEQGENSEILQTIISLAQNLKMKVIAEGIETETQLELLRSLNCDYGQGYLFSKPLPVEEMETLLYSKHFWFPKSFDVSSAAQPNSAVSRQKEEQLPIFN